MCKSACVFKLQDIQEITMTDHSGSCLCGSVSFKVTGEFNGFYLCHCKHCQKDTGSAYAANLFSQSAELVWQSGADTVTCFTLPGTRHNKSFCKLCGSALPSTQIPGLLVVPAGCLDTEISMVPTAHIFLSSKAVWDENSEDVPRLEGLPE
tara:strand:- start:13730 stop:14182 length:453 start_codon:yes stop_codon:yes gene_type:complete